MGGYNITGHRQQLQNAQNFQHLRGTCPNAPQLATPLVTNVSFLQSEKLHVLLYHSSQSLLLLSSAVASVNKYDA